MKLKISKTWKSLPYWLRGGIIGIGIGILAF